MNLYWKALKWCRFVGRHHDHRTTNLTRRQADHTVGVVLRKMNACLQMKSLTKYPTDHKKN